MCLFLLPNLSADKAYAKGVKYFECGACPECMQKRASSWALRAVYEARQHVHNCMITLTYDDFEYDSRGNIIGELPVNRDLRVQEDHVQKFMKRVRKFLVGSSTSDLKYIACAEYGSRTHRAHYHCIIFGYDFPDRVYYKKSKRGNPIYMSHTLTKLWGHGIATVDSINVFSAVARYCTKYCAKSRSDDTFMLFSHELGLNELLKDFNGLFYQIDGRKYPIPSTVWKAYISNRFRGSPLYFTTRNYASRYRAKGDFSAYMYYCQLLQRYYDLRDSLPEYQRYIKYWHDFVEMYDKIRPSVLQRIYNLDERKYASYKTAALQALRLRRLDISVVAPGSDCRSAWDRYCFKCWRDFFGTVYYQRISGGFCHLPFPSRPNTANDTNPISIVTIKRLMLQAQADELRRKKRLHDHIKQITALRQRQLDIYDVLFE